MFKLIDTHAHLEEIDDLEQVVAGARVAGLTAIIAMADMASHAQTLEIAARYPDFVYPVFGWHPWDIKELEIDANLAFIHGNIARAAAIGEVGLDYDKRVRARADKDLQKRVLRELLKIVKEYDKPACIHSRYAWRDAFDAVKEAGLTKAVFHWYTGTSGVLRDILDSGYYISVTPAVEYHEEHRRAVKETPLSQLLLETDSPVTYARGREGEFESRPADVLRSLKGAAMLKGMNEEEIAEATTANAKRLFEI